MKRGTLWLGLPTLVLAVGLSPFIPTVHAQSQGNQPSAQQEPGQQKSKAFVGQVVKTKSGQYGLLVDKQTGGGYFLDDQEKAQKFEGQTVRVVGMLDIATKTIHVTDIQPV